MEAQQIFEAQMASAMLGNLSKGMAMVENPTHPLEPFRYHVWLQI